MQKIFYKYFLVTDSR